MVAITVILAAVIAAFVFGMGPTEQAPQASIRASGDTVGTDKIIQLQHQGGEPLNMANTKITLSGNTNAGNVNISTTLASEEFSAGDTWYVTNTTSTNVTEPTELFNTKPGTVDNAIATSGDVITVTIVDVPSQQMIATMDVRF